MKKIIFIILLALISSTLLAQKTIERPEFGLSSFPGSITKIEILDTQTILHFHLKTSANSKVFIPEKSYIQDLHKNEKLFVNNATGITIGKWITTPKTGSLKYALYFPKLNPNVEFIDFGEANDNGSWFIYDLIITKKTNTSPLPKALRGNWKTTDGSNRWDYGFYLKNAIVNRTIWNYKYINLKEKKYTIVLERNGITKTIYAKLNKNGFVNFGINPNKLNTYSLKNIHNPNYAPKNNTPYTTPIFKIDSTTYSGVIKGYTSRAKEKTGLIYVTNVLTGNQDSHMVKIANDGSFSIKFPVNNPQIIYTKLPYSNSTALVVPGKETFHFVNGDDSLFMGDNAQINSDLLATKDINYFDFRKIVGNIGETSPEEYKKICFNARDKELKALKELSQKQFISKKALQIKKIDITYSALDRALGYNMYRENITRQNNAAKTEKQKRPFKNFKVDKSYYNFIPKEILNNKLAALSNSYSFFTNSLQYATIFTDKNASYIDRENKMKAFFGVSNNLTFDIIKLRRVTKKTNNFEIYTDNEIKTIQKEIKDPFISNYLKIENERTKVKIKANKAKGGYIVNTVKKDEGDELFDSMIKKYKGKVVYVDFWATWCAPCMSGIRKIVPLKEKMKDDNVVFLYITDESSPEGTWKNSISDIKGEHYRVSKDEWNYLSNKFNISGIPHYALVNKEGKIIKPKMGHTSIDKLRTILKTEIVK